MTKRAFDDDRAYQINPAIMMGKPVIRGTRITVELIMRKLAEGAGEADLLEDYPHLTTEDIRAAVAYGRFVRRSGALAVKPIAIGDTCRHA